MVTLEVSMLTYVFNKVWIRLSHHLELIKYVDSSPLVYFKNVFKELDLYAKKDLIPAVGLESDHSFLYTGPLIQQVLTVYNPVSGDSFT